MYSDVASGFNFKIGHFLYLNSVEEEKVTLRYIIRFRIQWKCSWLACVLRYLLNLSYNRTLRHRSAWKKKQFVDHRKKRTQIALILQRLNTRKS